MRLDWKLPWLAILMTLALFGTGCSGINAGGSASPASFFLPGLMKADPPAATPSPVAAAPSLQLALAR
ncbi:MAG: hypothetical protein ACLQAH_08850 [Limisphaerales bacterium]